MRDKILDDLARAVDNVHVPPVHPAMLGLERCRQQVIPRSSHRLPSRSLCRETVSVLHILTQRYAEILLDDGGAAEGDVVGARLYSLQLDGQHGEGVIGGVADEKSEIY